MTIKALKVADWARMFHDIDSVKKRVLLGEMPTKWHNLEEEQKLAKCEAMAKTIEEIALEEIAIAEKSQEYDIALVKNWKSITDLTSYGINV